MNFKIVSIVDEGLYLKSFFAFGGIPIPNSNTFTPKSFAAKKCPSSWIKTMMVNTKNVTHIPRKIYIVFCKNSGFII